MNLEVGNVYVTRNNDLVEILSISRNNAAYPVIGIVLNSHLQPLRYTLEGKCSINPLYSLFDLTEKYISLFAIDELVLVRHHGQLISRYYAGLVDGRHSVWINGHTSQELREIYEGCDISRLRVVYDECYHSSMS